MLKRIFRILRNILIVLILLGVALFFAIQHPTVQTWLAQRAADYLSGQLGAKVEIGRVEIDLWANLIIRDLYVEDQHQDTLAFIPELRLKEYTWDKKQGKFEVQEAVMESPYFQIQRHAEDTTLNIAFITNYINSFPPSEDTTGTEILLSNIQLRNARLAYNNEHSPIRTTFGIDWNHLYLDGLNLNLAQLYSKGDSLTGRIAHISAHEKTGFRIEDFVSEVTMVTGKVSLVDANIKTNASNIIGDLEFAFDSFDDFDYFEQRVKMKHQLKQTKLQLGDLAWFVSDLEGIDKTIYISGNIKGKVSELKGKKIEIQFDDNSVFKGDFNMDGLPEMSETFISLDVDKLTSNKRELERIPLPPFDGQHFLETPPNFEQLGQMTFAGNFTGYLHDFVAFGELNTAIGAVGSDIAFKEDTLHDDYYYSGSLKTTAFDLGKFYNDPNLGPVTADVSIDGSGLSVATLDAEFEGDIASINANQYTYNNIHLDGNFRQRYFSGDFYIEDENVEMLFSGTIDFKQAKPQLNFDAEIFNADLKKINVLKDYEYSSISGLISVESKGLDFANFEGVLEIKELTYCAKSKDYYLENLRLTAERQGDLKVTLDSDIATAQVEGKFDLKEFAPAMEEIISEILPSYQPPVRTHREQNFSIDMQVHDFTQVSEIFIPELRVANNTRVNLEVNEPQSSLVINVVSDSVSFQDNKITGLIIDAQRVDSSLFMNMLTDELVIGSTLDMIDFSLDTRTNKDTIYTALAWGRDESIHSGDLNGKLAVRGYQNFDFIFERSNLRINDQIWSLRQKGRVSVDSTQIDFNRFEMSSNGQSISLDGMISERPADVLNANITSFDIKNVNPFIGGEPNFYGIMSGTAAIRDAYGDMIFTNDITLLDFKLNDYLVGDLCVESLYENALKRLRIDGELEKEKFVPLSFAGYYKMNDKESPLDIVATVKDLDLAFINEFMSEGILDIQGKTTGTISLTGKPEDPLMRGTAYLNNASIFVDYLNTRYKIEEKIGIYPDMFTFDHIGIRDELNNPGFLTGQILHNAFGDWNFDIMIDMETPMLAMNTTEEMNSMYYGKAMTTGYVNIYGYDDQLEFDINVKTEKETSLAMPMNSSDDITFGNFIHFIDKTKPTVEPPLDLSGIKLNLNLDITPDAYFQIIFDEAIGDVMRGQGQGNLNMVINNLSTFNMYGTVELVKGNYLFTLKNLLNKEFSVRPGGTISWYGDPFAADLNLKTVYKVSASLKDILTDDVTGNSGQRVPIDLVMNLSGKMFKPAVAFDIELPTVDEVTKSRVQSVISTDQERNRQAFALLVMRRFVSPPNINTETTGTGNALAENGTELLSSQISNWLSQISDDFDLGFNYRPGDEISNEEIALALSTQLFNERLAISSNVGVSRGSSANQNPSNLIGDIRLEYKITPEGKIRLVVYNESNDFRMANTQQSPYTQGIGVVYQEEFDNWEEFICGFSNLFKKKNNQVKCY
jgi:hypothetical protein